MRQLQVHAAVGDAALQPLDDDEPLALGDPHRDVVIRYVLRAAGLGGAPVGHAGSDTEALSLVVPALPVDDTFLHVTLATIASVLVAGAIAFGFAYVITDGFHQGQSTEIGTVRCCD